MVKKVIEHQWNVFPSYRGGNTCVYGGYVFEFVPGHHLQNLWGFVSQHRLVAEDKIGRLLLRGEHVHHIDENRLNNHPNNLQVMTMMEHRKLHGQTVRISNLAKITRDQTTKALEGRSLKDAARILHVDTMTIRNRFPDLLEPRKRKTPVKIDEKTISKAIEMMLSGDFLAKEIINILGIGSVSLVRIWKKNNISPKWRKDSKAGEFRSHYRGRPTLRMLVLSGQVPELDGKVDYYRFGRLPKRLYRDVEGKP